MTFASSLERRPGYDSNLDRRELLRLLGRLAAGATLLPLTGCPPNGEERCRSLNFWGTGTLDIGDWSRFERNFDVAIEFEDNQNDPGPVLTKLQSPAEANSRHLSGLQGGAERTLQAMGAAIPWDEKLIPNLEKLWPWTRKIDYCFVNGERYGIPTVVNADSMIYLPQHVSVDSYAAIFDPDLRGRVSMEDAWINSIIFTAIYLKENQLQEIDNPGNHSLPR